MPELHVTGRENGGGEMRRDCGQANDKDDEKAAIAGETRHGAVIKVRAFEFDGFTAEQVLECEPSADCDAVSAKLTSFRGNELTFTEECSCCDDCESDP